MSEVTQDLTTEQPAAPVITPELIAAYQRQQAKEREQKRQQTIQVLKDLAAQAGFAIVAGPYIDEDGRLRADWGLMDAPK